MKNIGLFLMIIGVVLTMTACQKMAVNGHYIID